MPLIRALQDRDPARREGAAIALGRFSSQYKGPVPNLATEAVLALKAALHDDDVRVRVQAAGALWEINDLPEEVLPTVVPCLGDEDSCVRYRAREILAEIGPDSEDAKKLGFGDSVAYQARKIRWQRNRKETR